MKRFICSALFLAVCAPLPAQAQRAEEEMTKYDIVKLQSLNKVTARTMTFEAPVGQTVKFGPLYIRPQTCQEPPATEKPESAAFLQIWQASINQEAEESPLNDREKEKAEWVYSGWMFASSPGLASMDHPVYDVWVLDCMSSEEQKQKAETSTQDSEETATKEEQPGEEAAVSTEEEDSAAEPQVSEQTAEDTGEDEPVVREESSDVDFSDYDNAEEAEPTVQIE